MVSSRQQQQPRLRLALLGPPQVSLDGTQLPYIKSRKGVAMLAYLAVTGRPQARSRLAGLFWGYLSNAAAANNLRVVVHRLKKHLPGYLIITRTTVAFDRESDYWLDVEQIGSVSDRLVGGEKDIRHLDRSLSLYRGEFMEGFFLDDCPEFERWLLMERERWQQIVLRCFRYLIGEETKRGEYEAAVAHARRLLDIVPWYEEGHRQLMRLLAITGQRSAALAQYYRCRHILSADLGVVPGERTELLRRRIVQESKGAAGLFTVPTLSQQYGASAESTLSAVRYHLLGELRQAAERAWREYLHDDTLRFLAAALLLTKEEDGEQQWELLGIQERVHNFIADRAAQRQDLEAMAGLVGRRGDFRRLADLRVRQIQYACRVGEYTQALSWGKQVIEQGREQGMESTLARVYEVTAEACWHLGKYGEAREYVERALGRYLAEGDREGEVRARVGLGNIWRRLGKVEAARNEWEQALRLYRAQGNEWGAGLVLNNLGAVMIDAGDYESALGYHQQALSLRRRLGDRHGEGSSLNNLAITHYLLGSYEQAHEYATEAIALARDIGGRSWLVSFLETATRIELARRNYEEADRLCAEGLALSEEIGDRHNGAFYCHSAGEIHLARGEMEAARDAFDRACRLRRELSERGNLAASLAGRALARLGLGDEEAALSDVHESLALIEETGGAGEYPLHEIRERAQQVEEDMRLTMSN